MKTLSLSDQFHSWLLSTYNDPEFSEKVHCFVVKKRVLLTLGEIVDFVSIRHEQVSASDGRGIYSVGLWKFNIGAVDVDAVNEVCRHLQSFRSGCAEILNRLEMKGKSCLPAVRVHANLVGSCITAGAAIPLLANGFGDLSFWTYREGSNRIEVEPYYTESFLTKSQSRLFREFFDPGLCSGGRKKSGRSRELSPA